MEKGHKNNHIQRIKIINKDNNNLDDSEFLVKFFPKNNKNGNALICIEREINIPKKISNQITEAEKAKFYENMNRAGLDRNILENEDLSRAMSVISYGGISNVDGVFLDHELKIVKNYTGIEITYKVKNGDEITINYFDRIPCSVVCDITQSNIDDIIDKLQEGYPDETFISAAIIELEEFKKEIGRQYAGYPKMMNGLSRMNLQEFSFGYIVDNKESLFAEARRKYGEMWTNSLVEKEAKK